MIRDINAMDTPGFVSWITMVIAKTPFDCTRFQLHNFVRVNLHRVCDILVAMLDLFKFV